MKNIIFSFLILLCSIVSSYAAISTTPLQDTGYTCSPGGTNSCAVTITAASNGNILVLGYRGNTTTPTISSISTTNVTWTSVVASAVNGYSTLWFGVVAGGSSGTTVTITLSTTSAATYRGNVSEWSGVATSNFTDVSGSNDGTSTTPATGTITPTSSINALIIGAMSKGGTFSSGPTNSFTALATLNDAFQAAYRVIVSTTGTYSTDWTFTTSTAWDTTYAVFKPPSTGTTARKTLIGVGK